MTDNQIETLLANAKVAASAGFSERLEKALAADAAKDSRADELCNTMLKRAKVEASADFSARVCARLPRGDRSAFVRGICAFASAAAPAACLFMAALALPCAPKATVSEADFNRMSELTTEIYALQTLIVEGEFIDALNL